VKYVSLVFVIDSAFKLVVGVDGGNRFGVWVTSIVLVCNLGIGYRRSLWVMC